MPGQTLPERDLVTDKTGGQIPINMPKVGGGWKTKRIPVENLIPSSTPGVLLENKTGIFYHSVLANTYIDKLRIKKISGTPSVQIGTTPGGEDLMESSLITDWKPVLIDTYFLSDGALYFTITGGNVNIRIIQIINDL